MAAKLYELESLTRAQQEAIRYGNAELIEKLHEGIQTVSKDKGRAVEAWTRHHKEHEC